MPPIKTHDAISRRNRIQPISTGKRVTPQTRDLVWFKKLAEHGPLPSSFLHGFSQHLCRSEKRAKDRLTDLFNESNTPHRGAYLTRPWQQFETVDARYQELVYDLGEPARKALAETGQLPNVDKASGGPWKHRAMVAAITASIDLATLNEPLLQYIPGWRVLDRAKVDLRYPVEIVVPGTRKTRTVDLIPDALFGLEYRQGDKRTYRFFLVEADRGTEPSHASKFNRKSHHRSLLQYREYIGGGLYKQHLGLTAGLLVLNVFNDAATQNRVLELGEKIFERGNSYLLFQVAQDFAGPFRPFRYSTRFLHDTWQRLGLSGFQIFAP
jgi:hypothetical protein